MLRRLYIALIVLVSLLAASCSREREFRIEAVVDNMSAQSLKVLFWGDSGVVSTSLTPIDGVFRFKSTTGVPTLVTLAADGGKVIAQVVVSGGETLKVRADVENLSGVTVVGDDANAEWARWRASVSSLERPSAALDSAAREYVLAHRDSPVATWILLFDHSDITGDAASMALLDSIDIKARPMSLVNTVDFIAATRAPLPSSLAELYLIDSDRQEFTTVTMRGKMSLLLLWTTADTSYRRAFERMRLEADRHPDYRLIDINVDGDSVKWQRVLCAEAIERSMHLWAPCGPSEPSLEPLHLNHVPQILLCDSTTSLSSFR